MHGLKKIMPSWALDIARFSYNLIHAFVVQIVRILILGIVILIRPICEVRLILLDGGRINPLILVPEFLLRRSVHSPQQNKIKYILLTRDAANMAVVGMIRQYFPLWIIGGLYNFLSRGLRLNEFGAGEYYEIILSSQFQSVFNQSKNVMKLPQDIVTKGEAFLEKMGLAKDDWFICFSNRDSSYLDAQFPDLSWGYHDYRDSSILNYIEAMNEVVDRGGYAFRMGAVVSENLPDNLNPKIIDYARSHRDESLDIFLLSRCKFHVVGSTGISACSSAFDVPCGFTNFIPYSGVDPFFAKDLFITKRIWSESKGRFLTFQECHEYGLFDVRSGAGFSKFYEERSLKPEENDAAEIAALTRELFDLGQDVVPSKELQELQLQYKERFRSHVAEFNDFPDVSANFLAMHPELMSACAHSMHETSMV